MVSLEIAKIAVAFFSPILSAFLVIRGWQVASEEQNEREVRKELREEIGRVSTQLNSVNHLAMVIWTSKPADVSQQQILQLLTELGQVSRIVTRLKVYGINVTMDVAILRRRLTLDIEQSSRRVLADTDTFTRDVDFLSQNIEDRLRDAFSHRFPMERLSFINFLRRIFSLR